MDYVERLMITYTKTYIPTAGSTEIFDAALVYVNVLRVTRTGDNHDVFDYISSPVDATGYQVAYNKAAGSLGFDPNRPFETGEFVNVIYKR